MRIAGRLMLIKIGDGADPEEFTTVAAQRGTSQSLSSQSIDTTSKDSVWRQLMGGGVQAQTITAKGLIADAASHLLLSKLASQDEARNFQIIFANGQMLTGRYIVETWALSAEYSAVQQYELTLQSANNVAIPPEPGSAAFLITESGDVLFATEAGDAVIIAE